MLAMVSGYLDRIVPRDTVWVDETYINDTDLSKGYGRARKRGMSRQKPCICVAIDVHKNPVGGRLRPREAELGACGTPWAAGWRPGHCSSMTSSGANDALVRGGGLESEAHRADANGPVYLERMETVNDLCSRLKRYLWRFTGMSLRNPQAYLDWYVYLFRVNRTRDRRGPAARVVRHILMAGATYRSLG